MAGGTWPGFARYLVPQRHGADGREGSHVRDGDFRAFSNGQAVDGWVQDGRRKEPAAWMDEVLVGRNAGLIAAAGGPCPIISVFDPESRIGALVHVGGGDAEVDGDDHEELVAALLELVPDLPRTAKAAISLDRAPLEELAGTEIAATAEELREQAETRTAYADRLGRCLKRHGFADVTFVTEGVGKYVQLDTSTGVLTVLADSDEVLFRAEY